METSSSAAMEQINDTYTETNEDVPDSNIIKQTLIIWRILPPFFIILGTFGNILIIAVLNKTISNKHATGIFLRALAFSDILGLYVGLCAEWIAYLADRKMLEKGTFLCKVLPWITYSVLDFSAWILVAVTIERVIATCFPLSAKSLCTKNFAFGYIVASGTILLAINAHMLKGFEYVEEDNDYFCDETPTSYKHFFKHVWPWIDIFIYSLLPFIVIFVGNLTIFLRVKRSRKRSLKTRNVSLDSSKKRSSLPRPIHKFSHLTVTLFLINTAFLISTCPVSIFLLVEINLPPEYFEDSSNEASLEMAWAIVYILMYINNAVNVFLYCLSGTRFRSGVKNLYRSFKINPPSRSSSLSRGRSFDEYSSSIRGKQSSSSYMQATPDTHDSQNQASVMDNDKQLGETDVFLKNNLTSACSNLDNKDNTNLEDKSIPQNDTYL